MTIKFGKGLVGEPFISKAGKELVEIKIPNRDARDHRPWESFVVSPKMVHENQYGAGVWMKLPADGTTKVSRPEYRGRDESGKSIWGTESRTVSNQELKALMESYKERNRESVRSALEEKKAESFKLTYEAEDSLYLCIGYGEQATGGYSISVNELYLSENAIYFDTNLIGPDPSETVAETVSCPYLVVKTEYLDKPVVFQ